jgi:hypothetical protein
MDVVKGDYIINSAHTEVRLRSDGEGLTPRYVYHIPEVLVNLVKSGCLGGIFQIYFSDKV